jgi:hypothetical protein
MEDIKHLTNSDTIVFIGGTNDVSKNNSQDGLKHIINFVNVNSHTNIILMGVPHLACSAVPQPTAPPRAPQM